MHDERRFLDAAGRLKQWPSKRVDQLLVLAYLATKFVFDQTYTEAEVNDQLKHWHTFSDWPLLRRELFDGGFMTRNADGTDYRLWRQSTRLQELVLARPDIEHDPPLAVPWLAGAVGHETLRLMGNSETDNHPSTLEEERKRMREFITDTKTRTWMLRYRDTTVGAIWVDLDPSPYLAAPSVHMMIGDPSVRGKGIGSAAVEAVLELLKREDVSELHSRHLVDNDGSKALLHKLGFINDGEPYTDHGLAFQNVVRKN